MYILYVDESGTESDGGTSHFVLLGLAIKAENWREFDLKLEAIKQKYQLEGTEIHTSFLARRYAEQEAIPDFEKLAPSDRKFEVARKIEERSGVLGVRGDKVRIKAYRRVCQRTQAYVHLTRTERIECLCELSMEIGKWSEARIFAEAIKKSCFSNTKLSVYEQAFEQITSRFQAFLFNVNDKGIMVHDNNTSVAQKLTNLSKEFHKSGTFWRKISNVVETPLFVDSQLTSMIQMADLSAYALRRFIENSEDYLWRNVESRVDRAYGRLVGVRHFTGKLPCACSICQVHGRM